MVNSRFIVCRAPVSFDLPIIEPVIVEVANILSRAASGQDQWPPGNPVLDTFCSKSTIEPGPVPLCPRMSERAE